MYFISLVFRASFPLVAIIYFWSSGTSPSEYESNFKTISGEVKGPFIGFYEDYNLITNDTLEWTSYSYSKFESLLREHDLTQSYFKFVNKVKTHDINWGTNQIDSLIEMPTEKEWNNIITTNEGIVYSDDTVFHSDARYPIEVPVKLTVIRSLSVRVFFSLGSNPDQLQIVFPDKNSEDNTKNLPGHVKGYLAKSGKSYIDYLEIKESFKKLDEFIKPYKTLSVERLKPSRGRGRVYKIWDEKDKLVFEDEDGIDGLKYKTKIRQSVDVFESNLNEDFVLWYDNWLVKFLIALQALIYTIVFFDIRNSIRRSKTN